MATTINYFGETILYKYCGSSLTSPFYNTSIELDGINYGMLMTEYQIGYRTFSMLFELLLFTALSLSMSYGMKLLTLSVSKLCCCCCNRKESNTCFDLWYKIKPVILWFSVLFTLCITVTAWYHLVHEIDSYYRFVDQTSEGGPFGTSCTEVGVLYGRRWRNCGITGGNIYDEGLLQKYGACNEIMVSKATSLYTTFYDDCGVNVWLGLLKDDDENTIKEVTRIVCKISYKLLLFSNPILFEYSIIVFMVLDGILFNLVMMCLSCLPSCLCAFTACCVCCREPVCKSDWCPYGNSCYCNCCGTWCILGWGSIHSVWYGVNFIVILVLIIGVVLSMAFIAFCCSLVLMGVFVLCNIIQLSCRNDNKSQDDEQGAKIRTIDLIAGRLTRIKETSDTSRNDANTSRVANHLEKRIQKLQGKSTNIIREMDRKRSRPRDMCKQNSRLKKKIRETERQQSALEAGELDVYVGACFVSKRGLQRIAIANTVVPLITPFLVIISISVTQISICLMLVHFNGSEWDWYGAWYWFTPFFTGFYHSFLQTFESFEHFQRYIHYILSLSFSWDALFDLLSTFEEIKFTILFLKACGQFLFRLSV
eukprot:235695_1